MEITAEKKRFYEWLMDVSFYIGYARYGQFGKHGHVCVATFGGSPDVRKLVETLDDGDVEAIDSAMQLSGMEAKGDIWLSCDKDPLLMMTKIMSKIETHYQTDVKEPT